ncbi:MAG TPA: DUF1801 domain-containing protein [Thermoanaerobaculia bacterium]
MAEVKTKPTSGDVLRFIDGVQDEKRRADCLTLVDLMREIVGEEPVMWGPAIIGFGRYRYKYESGREGESMVAGFSPRKSDLTLYLMSGFEGKDELMAKLGKHKTGKSCLYLKRLSDVDAVVLRELVSRSVAQMAGQRISAG